MKKNYFLVIAMLTFMTVLVAQPQKMSYQTVVRDANNELVVNQQVGVQITVIQDSMNGPMIYRETHTATTNGNALVTLAIGTGTHLYNNNLSDVKWGEHDHYLRVDIDPTGGINYTITGTQQLITVPYAFYAGAAKYVDTALYALNSNSVEKQVIVISNDTIYLKGDTNSFVKLPIAYVPDSISAFINDVGYLTSDSLPSNVSYFNNDAGYLTSDSLPANVSYFNNDAGYITSAAIPANVSYFNNDAGYITTFVDSQQISLSGDTLKLERGGSVLLAPSCCALVDSLNNVISVLQSIVCKPKVVTAVVTAISTDTAVCGGAATSPCGYAITEKGVCWNTTGFADMSDSHTSDGIGTGIFSSVLTGLSPNTTYYVRAYAICGTDTVYGSDRVFTTISPLCSNFLDEQTDTILACGGVGSYLWHGKTLTTSGIYYDSLKTANGGCDSIYKINLTITPLRVADCDGNWYNTVQIGSQCWLKENLRVKNYEYSGGPAMIDATNASDSSSVYAYYWHVNLNPTNDSVYGLLYNWTAAMGGYASSKTEPSGVQGICPNGWHLPSDTEWTILEDYAKIHYPCYYLAEDYDEDWNMIYIPDTGYAKALAATTTWDNRNDNSCQLGYNQQQTNNASDFSMVAPGYVFLGLPEYAAWIYGNYNTFQFNYNTYFWTATKYELDDSKAYSRTASSDGTKFYRGIYGTLKTTGCSVRCIKD